MSDTATEDTAEGTDDGAESAAPDAETRYGALLDDSRGQAVIHPSRETWRETAEALYEDNWTMLADLTAVDYLTFRGRRPLPPGVEGERFEVVASFVRFDNGERIRMRCQVPEADPVIDSIQEIYPGCDFLEREVFDMFGIAFEGHPDLSRILMPETWIGHPLRKDFAKGTIPVKFKQPQGESSKEN